MHGRVQQQTAATATTGTDLCCRPAKTSDLRQRPSATAARLVRIEGTLFEASPNSALSSWRAWRTRRGASRAAPPPHRSTRTSPGASPRIPPKATHPPDRAARIRAGLTGRRNPGARGTLAPGPPAGSPSYPSAKIATASQARQRSAPAIILFKDQGYWRTPSRKSERRWATTSACGRFASRPSPVSADTDAARAARSAPGVIAPM